VAARFDAEAPLPYTLGHLPESRNVTTPFTRNYADRSNDNGYQFEFFCDKCGNGYRSAFVTSKLGMASSLLKAAGTLFGGALTNAGWGAGQLKDALRGPAWDSAFEEAIQEVRGKFHQCTRCGKWVCPDACWNEARQLCEECAPDLAEEAAHIQAEVATEQVRQKAQAENLVEHVDVKATKVAACPHCNARVDGGKFCPTCGKPLAATVFCAQCGAELSAHAKFCSACGAARK
jgi:hypothetical protein